jgi:hypothetical protein
MQLCCPTITWRKQEILSAAGLGCRERSEEHISTPKIVRLSVGGKRIANDIANYRIAIPCNHVGYDCDYMKADSQAVFDNNVHVSRFFC